MATNYEYGKDIYKDKTLLNLIFKTDILELCFYIFTKTYIFLIFILPFKIVFRKSIRTFLVFFKDGSFLNIVPNKKTEYNQILAFLKNQNITIKKQTKFCIHFI